MRPIQLFLRGCRRRLFRFKMADSTGVQLTGGSLLTAALIVRQLLRRTKVVNSEQQMIGVLLPPSVGAALANTGIGLCGKVAVNLNYGFSADTVNHCIEECCIRHVITSRRLLKQRHLQLNVEYVYLEDFRKQATLLDRLYAAVLAYAVPVLLLEIFLGLTRPATDDVMAILFTSGTTGDPKGVMLSHRNIASSIDAIRRVYRVDKQDVSLGILPFFHAFGYSATLWLPLAMNMGVVYHYDPFGTKAIAKLARQFRATLLYATPTFLGLYLRRCSEDDLASLDLAVVGAEKLNPDLAIAFADKFGATAVEGYGTTELSPWAAVNVPPHRSLSGHVAGSRPGTVGRALPGIQVKIVDPESGAEQETGQPGLLFVRGPNVMAGYWNNPEKTAEVIQDGWYNTGDFARIDTDGFIEITGRQSRFSKIGGETVPHQLIEELITQIAADHQEPSNGQQVAVTAVSDPRKGERLVVVYESLGHHTPDEMIQKLSVQGLPNLWIPRSSDFVQVDEIPLTSLGKVDLGALQQTAKRACGRVSR